MDYIKRIEQIIDQSAIEAWIAAFANCEFNRYGRQALRGFLEEMEHHRDRRDDVDQLRSGFEIDPESRRQRPNEIQRRRLYSTTKIYFDTYYGALSHLSSVVGRFSKIFGGVAYADNKPFLAWLRKYHAGLPVNINAGNIAFHQLEAARLFRARLTIRNSLLRPTGQLKRALDMR